ncbi:MAG: Rho termination factor N-terminal domain-containing protein [Nostoc sp.]|uniref:Rho termination factor N-terminal domain-containing protein n=1 Tax=Nostoc sp. TaxID=1180 RepID=UPI002FFB72AC
MNEVTQYPHIGQFHWKYFQKENGKRNVAVSSTVPRVEMMLESGLVKEFTDKKRCHNYSVLFDSEYVFDYLYQKIVVNMGWSMGDKLDSNVLRCFLDDFLLHCEEVHRQKDVPDIKAQAQYLATQFPHKTVQEWERELLGNKASSESDEMTFEPPFPYGQNDDIDFDGTKVKPKDDCDSDVEKNCNMPDDDISAKSIRNLKNLASKMKIKGYGSMSKDTLIAAITCNR